LGWFGGLVAYSSLPARQSARDGWRAFLVLGLVLGATSLYRVQGIILIAAILALIAIERRGARAWLVFAAASTAPLLLWGAIQRTLRAAGPVSSHPDELSYSAGVSLQRDLGTVLGAIERVGRNVTDYVQMFAHYASGSETVGSMLVLALVGAAVHGMWRTLRRAPALAVTTVPMVAVV